MFPLSPPVHFCLKMDPCIQNRRTHSLTWYRLILSCFSCSNFRFSSAWRSTFFCARPTNTIFPLISFPFISSTAWTGVQTENSCQIVNQSGSYSYYYQLECQQSIPLSCNITFVLHLNKGLVKYKLKLSAGTILTQLTLNSGLSADM